MSDVGKQFYAFEELKDLQEQEHTIFVYSDKNKDARSVAPILAQKTLH